MGAEIVTIGETMVLLYGEDTTAPLQFGERLKLDFAGADSNFAIAMSRLGYRSAWISRLGDEPLGDLVLRAIAREGVDVSQVIRDPTRNTGLYLKHHDGTGRRGSACRWTPFRAWRLQGAGGRRCRRSRRRIRRGIPGLVSSRSLSI